MIFYVNHLIMNKKELILKISKNTGENKNICNKILNSFFDNILQELLCGETVSLFGFGKFFVKEKLPRIYFSPIKKAYLKSECKHMVCFVPSKRLKIGIS